MSVRTDVINLNVNINGNKAQNDLNNLRKKAADVKLEMEGLKKGTEAYIAKKKELAGITQEMADLKTQIGITALSQKELVAELNKLKALRGSVVPFTKEYKDLSESIAKVEKRLYDVKNGVQGFASFFSKIKDEVKQFGAVAAGYLGFQFITSQFQNIIRSGAKLSDQLADIRRVTGFTGEEVKELNKQLGTLNTRTSTEGLRQIAIIAGKLGIAKDDIFEFTAAVDQLVVALGDELGDADQITTQLGKIINVFDKTGKVTGDNILRAGNALVSLANSGVATGGFIVDFTQRLAGLAKTANLSIEASFGLGAALEELGQRSESSSTAIIKVLGSIGKDVPKFAKIAGMSVEAFTEILRTAPEEALIRLSEALVKGKVGFDEISKAFDAAGEDGARVVTTLGVIGGKAEFVRDKIRDAGTALKETGEITEAFALKNENFGAVYDKVGKKIAKFISDSWISRFVKSLIYGISDLIDAISKLPKFIEQNRNAILTLIAGLLILNRQYIISAAVIIRDTAAKWLNIIATRTSAVTTNIAGVAQTAYAIIVSALTGKITLATAAQRLWNVAMSIGLGPVGILITAIGALAVAMGALGGKTKVLAAEQRNLSEINAKVTDDIGSQVTNMQRLTEIAKDNNLSLDTRKKALNELIKINPQYLSGLTLENIALKEGITILDTYSFMLKKVAQDKARLAVQDELQKEKTRLEVERPGLEVDANNSSVFNPFDRSDKKLIGNLERTKEINDQLGLIDAQIKGSVQGISDLLRLEEKQLTNLKQGTAEYNNQLLKIDLLKKRQTILLGGDPNAPAATGGGGGITPPVDKDADKKAKKLKDELEQFKKEVEKLRRDMELNGKTADEQEVIRVEQKYAELLEKAKKYNYGLLEIEGFKKKELDALFQKQMQKRMEEQQAADYDDDVARLEEYYRTVARKRAADYADGRMSKEQYDEQVKESDRKQLSDRISLAGDYSGTVKKAAADITAFTKTQQEQQTADLVTETDKRIAKTNEEKLAAAQRKVLTTRKGSNENVDARKDEMKERFRQETEFLDKRSELYLLKEAELQEGLKEIDKEALEGRLGRLLEWMNLVGQAFQSLSDIVKNIEERGLQRERKNNEKKKEGYKKQLDSKLINQTQYDRKVAAADAEMERKEKEAKRRQAKRDKAIAIFQALINTGAAIMQTWARWGFPQGIPFAIAQGVAGALQIGAIASAPLPELGKGDWVREGDKHSDRSGGINARIERDEAVVSAAAMTDRDVVTVTGNTAQITSALNSRRGGRSWAAGAKVVDMPAWVTQRPAAINSNVPGILKQGAFNGSSSNNSSNVDLQQMVELNKAMLVEMQSNTEEIKTMKKNLKAFVVIKEFREESSKYDAAKNAAGVKQG
jgi:TP901 family phage tail tape measure protein